jgi:hypothetical protein
MTRRPSVSSLSFRPTGEIFLETVRADVSEPMNRKRKFAAAVH